MPPTRRTRVRQPGERHHRRQSTLGRVPPDPQQPCPEPGALSARCCFGSEISCVSREEGPQGPEAPLRAPGFPRSRHEKPCPPSWLPGSGEQGEGPSAPAGGGRAGGSGVRRGESDCRLTSLPIPGGGGLPRPGRVAVWLFHVGSPGSEQDPEDGPGEAVRAAGTEGLRCPPKSSTWRPSSPEPPLGCPCPLHPCWLGRESRRTLASAEHPL